jgi:hypothetical protein
MSHLESAHINTQASLGTLCRVARLSNSLAKQLTGPARTLAYRIKAEACSQLILSGGANVNGVWPTGIVALNLHGNPPSRIHVRRSHLSPEARAAVSHQASSVPAVTRLAEHFRRTEPSGMSGWRVIKPTTRRKA